MGTYAYTVHVFSLACSLASVVLSGFFAAIVFPMMKNLKPVLPGVSVLASDHWKMAAGYPTAMVFYVSAAAQCVLLVCAGVALWVLARSTAYGVKSGSGAKWSVRGFVSTVSVWGVTQAAVIIPMSMALGRYRQEAAAGNEAGALTAQRVFQNFHNISSVMLLVIAAMLMANVCLAPLLLRASRGAGV
jgi:hypothetical protein